MFIQNNGKLIFDQDIPEIIHTIAPQCKTCYLCVRNCPVGAIRVANGLAMIEQDLCIHCGRCVRKCPQHAKVVMSSLDKVREWIKFGRTVIVSLAPSFASAFGEANASRMPALLKKLGFKYALETAEGAKLVSELSMDYLPEKNITTACPAVVSYVEKYYPEYIDFLIPVVSPMVAHGRLIKRYYGHNCLVVFIGPCVAKKYEALRPENRDAIDAVLTFQELQQWIDESGIGFDDLPEEEFEQTGLVSNQLEYARQYPVEGGMLKTCGILPDSTDTQFLHLSGFRALHDVFDHDVLSSGECQAIEPLFCKGGCLNGPCFPNKDLNLIRRKSEVINYARKSSADDMDDPTYTQPNLSVGEASFRRDNSVELPEFSEAEINEVLAKTGKTDQQSQLNCGSCGYATCRDKAIAVLRGMAELEMCLPYMRKQASQRTDRIIETMPDAVVICDDNLNMIHMNPAFQKMFMCSNSVLGRPISYILTADGFDKLMNGGEDQNEAIRTKYGIKYHEKLYALRNEHQYVGIFSDISNMSLSDFHMDVLKQQTMEQAKNLLFHQIRFAQEMTNYLGQSTAQSENMLNNLMTAFGEDITMLKDE